MLLGYGAFTGMGGYKSVIFWDTISSNGVASRLLDFSLVAFTCKKVVQFSGACYDVVYYLMGFDGVMIALLRDQAITSWLSS